MNGRVSVAVKESTAWWSAQSKDLFALTEEGEMGMMQAMVTTVEGQTVLHHLREVNRKRTHTHRIEFF